METFEINHLRIALNQKGARAYAKVSYPLRYGRFMEIRSPEHVFQFNLNGELKFISGRGEDWPDRSEWLKRTLGNDWVYYSTGGYEGLYDCFGEYYLPRLSYPSNAFHSADPFTDKAVITAIEAWERLHADLTELGSSALPDGLKPFIERVIVHSPEALRRRGKRLREILGDRITVLPPDTRHVDYEVVPVIIADGCLHRCAFCRVKSRLAFGERSEGAIETQIRELRAFFDRDTANYNSLFLGQHDALNASADLIEFSARRAYEAFDISRSNLAGPSLFLFGSVDSFLGAGDALFRRLERLPYLTYINVGFESADQETLDALGKDISREAVERAFARAVEINKRYEKIEITGNLVFGKGLPAGHIPSFFRLMEKSFSRPFPKGAVYFSPLMAEKDAGWKRSVRREFLRLKVRIPVPSFLYLIQRL